MSTLENMKQKEEKIINMVRGRKISNTEKENAERKQRIFKMVLDIAKDMMYSYYNDDEENELNEDEKNAIFTDNKNRIYNSVALLMEQYHNELNNLEANLILKKEYLYNDIYYYLFSDTY